MSRFKKFLISWGLIVLLLGAGGSLAALLHWTRPQLPTAKKNLLPQLVETIELVAQDRVERIVGYGTARADQVATLTAEVSAAVVELTDDLEVGMRVAKEQLLVRLDDREYQEQLRRAFQLAQADQAEINQLQVERENVRKLVAIAKAKTQIAESEMRRVESLYREGNAAESELNRVRVTYQESLQNLQGLENQLALIDPRVARLEAAKRAHRNEAAVAQLHVDRCRIRAPFDGQIDELTVEVGDSVRPGTAIARIISPDRIEIPVELAVSMRDRIRLGASCTLTVDSMPGVTWRGVVSRIAPSADERSRTFAAYVEVDNMEQAAPLIPGYFLRAEITGPVFKSVLVVPRGAIVKDQVFIAQDGRARARTVRVECLLEDQAVVTGPIKRGNRVIVTNLDILYDGAPIRTKPTGT